PQQSLEAPPPSAGLTARDGVALVVIAALAASPSLALIETGKPTAALAAISSALVSAGRAAPGRRGRRRIAAGAAAYRVAQQAREQERALARQDEAQLRESHARALARAERSFERFFEDAPFGIGLADADTRLLECNRAFRRLCGLSDVSPGHRLL